MKLHLVCTSLILVSSLVACGRFDYSLINTTPVPKVMPQEIFYHTTGSCSDGSFNFSFLQGAGIMLWTDPTQVLVGQGELYIQPDMTYSFRYREFTWDQTAFDKMLTGTVTFNDETGVVQFENLGSAHITTYYRRTALELTFAENINNGLLQNQKAYFYVTTGRSGLGETDVDHCHY